MIAAFVSQLLMYLSFEHSNLIEN